MSKTAVIVALLVAVGLGIAAFFLTQGPPAASNSGSLLSIDPSAVTEIRVDFPDGSSQAVRRGESEWQVVLSAPGSPARSWPASQTQVHAALRIFASLAAEQPAEGTVSKAAGTLIVQSGDASQTLKIGDQRLAGRVLVEADSRAAWVDAALAEMLITTGIRAWRDPAALPGGGTDASRVTIKGHTGSSLALGRVQGAWSIREPISEPADPDAVSRLLSILGSVRIVDFCDQGAPTHARLDSPIATLTLESDRRDAAGRAVTVQNSIIVGQAADVAGRTVFARLDRKGGETESSDVVILAGEQLAAISADAAQYLSKSAVQTEAAEIGLVVVNAAHVESPCKKQALRRTLSGWESQCGEEAWRIAPAPDAQAVAALLEMLTVTPPETIALRTGEPVVTAAATIELSSLGGSPIGRVEAVIEGTRVVVLTERVRRQYAPGIGQVVAEWLGRR